MKPFQIVYVAAAFGLAAFSCASTAENTGVLVGANPAEYFVGHGGLDRTLQLANYRKRENNGLLEVQVELRNTTSSDVSVEYSFEWFDAQGFKIETPVEHWVPYTLHGNQVRVVAAISPRTGAEKFKIHVRYPKEVTR